MVTDVFYRKFNENDIVGDGNCLFRALAVGIREHQKYYQRIKAFMKQWCLQHPDLTLQIANGRETVQSILQVLSTEKAWGGDVTIDLAQRCFNVAVYVWMESDVYSGIYQVASSPLAEVESPRKVIHLLWKNHNHYNYLVPNTMYIPEDNVRSARRCSECSSDRGSDRISDQLSEWCSVEPDPDDFPDGRRLSLDSATSASSGNTRPSNFSFAARVTHDVMGDVEKVLGMDRPCCERGCLRVRYAAGSNGVKELCSQVVNRPSDVILQTRHFVCSRTQTERRTFVYRIFSAGMSTDAAGKQTYRVTIEYFEEGTLQKIEVCKKAFKAFYGVTSNMLSRVKKSLRDYSQLLPSAAQQKAAIHSTQSGAKDLTHDEHECVAFIRSFAETNGEKMPHQTSIRIPFQKTHVYKTYVSFSRTRQLQYFAKTKFYDLWNAHCADITVARWKGDFAMCNVCKEFAQMFYNPQLPERERVFGKQKHAQHIATVMECKKGYYHRQHKAINSPNTYMSMIIDGCDSTTTLLPNIRIQAKAEKQHPEAFLKHKLMGVRVHALHKRDYLYMLPPFAAETVGCNLTLDALQRTLTKEAEYRQQQRLRWPSILYLQLDNTSKDNKNQTVFAYLSWLVKEGIFREIYVNFLPVGHTHEDIDQLFSVISGKLRNNDAYTFTQWKHEIFGAFNDENDRITSIEYIWALRNFRQWLAPYARSAYQGIRECYHYKIYMYRNEAVMSYIKYEYMLHMDGGQYWPQDQPQSWLTGTVEGEPEIDATCGTWPSEHTGKANVTDRDSYFVELCKLLRLPTNRATQEDINEWQQWLRRIPAVGDYIDPGLYPEFKLPDVDHVNNCAAEQFYETDVIDDFQPEQPVQYDILLQQGYTKAQRREIRKIQEDAQQSRPLLTANVGEFVIFQKDPKDWEELARTQEGFTEAAASVPFGLGHVKHVTGDDIGVHVYRTEDGDPNGRWYAWIHAGQGQRPWILNVPKHSVLLVNPEFARKSGAGRKSLSAKTKKHLSEIPGFPYNYMPRLGLVTWEEAQEHIQSQLKDLPSTASRENLRKKARLTNELRHQTRKMYTLTKVAETTRARQENDETQCDTMAEI